MLWFLGVIVVIFIASGITAVVYKNNVPKPVPKNPLDQYQKMMDIKLDKTEKDTATGTYISLVKVDEDVLGKAFGDFNIIWPGDTNVDNERFTEGEPHSRVYNGYYYRIVLFHLDKSDRIATVELTSERAD